MLSAPVLPGARWFEGATLNYAEHMVGLDEDTDRVAIVARSQSRDPFEVTFGELRDQVARARAGLERLGVGPGDRVVAYLPNIPETLVAFLATASLGAVWATCAPEFGARAVIDRFGIVEPTVLLAVAGYGYGAKHVDRRDEVAAIRAEPARSSTSSTCPTRAATATACRGRSAGPSSWPSPRSCASTRCRSTTRCAFCSRPARPGCPSRSSTATAGSSSRASRTSA